jgi:hypothetical protein
MLSSRHRHEWKQGRSCGRAFWYDTAGIAESHRLFNPAQQVARLSCGYQDNADHNAAVNILARNEPLDANVSGVALCVV